MSNTRNETLRERIGTLVQRARNGELTADQSAALIVQLVASEEFANRASFH